ncbi:hypothetical protein [Vogesella oryzae]|uniref:hypothetical protein n=1 Tax=Vogesella oryzae TaxID=1735285 RepID=UPI0015814A51|nr:hypothetical protein [Vogesella oryzae]
MANRKVTVDIQKYRGVKNSVIFKWLRSAVSILRILPAGVYLAAAAFKTAMPFNHCRPPQPKPASPAVTPSAMQQGAARLLAVLNAVALITRQLRPIKRLPPAAAAAGALWRTCAARYPAAVPGPLRPVPR